MKACEDWKLEQSDFNLPVSWFLCGQIGQQHFFLWSTYLAYGNLNRWLQNPQSSLRFLGVFINISKKLLLQTQSMFLEETDFGAF